MRIRMKNLIFGALVAVLSVCSTSTFADVDDLPLGYHSVGVDTYGDGVTPVVDGECYALVWTATDHTFMGFKADGTLVDEENNGVVYLRSMAKNGKCPPVAFIVPRSYRDAHPEGEYRVVVLDTRSAQGVLAGLDANGTLRRVNGWGWAKGKVTRKDKIARYFNPAAIPAGAHVGTASTMPKNRRRPRITNFSFDADGNAVIEFKGSERYLSYRVSKGRSPASIGEEKGSNLKEGAGDDATPVRIVIPKSELSADHGFFGIDAKDDWTVQK